MICKYCSAKIDPDSEVCPNCGKRGNIRQGGNGFWDIARGSREEDSPKPIEEHTPKSAMAFAPIAACALLCIISIIVAMICVSSSSRKINVIRKNFEAQIAEQNIQSKEEMNELQSQINQLSERLDELLSRSIEEESFRIVSFPTTETCSVGFQSKPGYYLFGLQVEGRVAAFQWEKQLESGDWVTVMFDESNINEQLGLRLEESVTDGTSRLVAIGLTPISFGTYKCTVIGADGTVQVAVVDLISSAMMDREASNSLPFGDSMTAVSQLFDINASNPSGVEDDTTDTDSQDGAKQNGGW